MPNVQGIGQLGNTISNFVNKPVDADRSNSQVFNDLLEAASGMIKETNTSLNSYEDMQLKIASGESDDFIGLTLMQNKANSTMQFFVQASNKAVEAYREIMRIQI